MSKNLELMFPKGVDLVDLPSQGKYYKKEHPLYEQKCTEILHMRGAEEDILTNKDFIRRDIVIDKLLKSLLVDQNVKSDQHYSKILVADQVAMILRARITAYTWEYPTTLTCPNCKTNVNFSFDLRKFEVKHPDLDNDENIKYDSEQNEFIIKIPNLDIVVRTKPLTIEVQKKISAKLLAKKDKILSTKEKVENLIVSINDDTSKEIVDEFFKLAPAFYTKWLEQAIQDTHVDISFEQEFECPNCSFNEKISPPFTTDFLLTPKIMRNKQ